MEIREAWFSKFGVEEINWPAKRPDLTPADLINGPLPGWELIAAARLPIIVESIPKK